MYSYERISKIISNFNNIKTLVVGDVMLDTYEYGRTDRQNPEKRPVPLVTIEKEIHMLGGAANTANNISHLGSNVVLYGVVSYDDIGERIINLCIENKIGSRIIKIKRNTSIHKVRTIGDDHYIVRRDKEDTTPLSEHETNIFKEKLLDTDLRSNLYIFSDYDKGLMNQSLAQHIIKKAKENNSIVFAQPKPKNADLYRGVNVIMLNLKEAEDIASDKINGNKNLKSLKTQNLEEYKLNLGRTLLEYFNYDSDIVITYGKDGIGYYGKNAKIVHMPTKPVISTDITYQGAGDTALAALALSYVSSKSIDESLIIANHAAWLAIQQSGTTAVTLEMLLDSYPLFGEEAPHFSV